jgi:hypothetical protein
MRAEIDIVRSRTMHVLCRCNGATHRRTPQHTKKHLRVVANSDRVCAHGDIVSATWRRAAECVCGSHQPSEKRLGHEWK